MTRLRTLPRSSQWPALLFCAVIASLPMAAVPSAAEKKPITHDVYDGWRSIQGTQLSRDGTWLVYALTPQDGDGELVARNLKTGAEFRHPRGRAPVITPDGTAVVFTIAPLKADVDKAKKAKKKPEDQPKSGLGIMALSNGQVATVEKVKSFKVPAESSRWVAYLMEPVKDKTAEKADDKKEEEKSEETDKPKKKDKKKDPGSELIVREISSGSTSSIHEATEYDWAKDGAWLAYAVSSKVPEKDGVFARQSSDGATRALLSGLGNYKQLAFDEAGKQLAFASDRDEYKSDPAAFKLYHWVPADRTASVLVTASTAGMPAGFSVSDNGRVTFSKDGSKVFIGTAPLPPPEVEDAAEPIKVDIWSWKDPLLQPMQKVRADTEKKRTYQAVVHIKDRKLVQLASAEMPDVNFVEGTNAAVGESDVAYRQLVSWDGSYNDVFVVDLRTGARQKLLEKSYFGARMSPGGNYLLWYDDTARAWFAQRATAAAKPVNLTADLKVSFQDETWDTPNQPAPYGSPGWTEGDKSVLLYDRYDIWEVKPDGSGARMITKGLGREGKLAFRYQRLDPEERAIPAAKPILLSTTDDRTKATGYYRTALSGTSAPEKIIMADKQFGGVIKAKNADVVVLTAQRFEEFPDLWVTTTAFGDLKKVTDANPQQAHYRWGRSELIDYVNTDGKPLRAILTKPEDFDSSKKYPLMVYIYEELTNGLHRYSAPSPGTSVNMARYVSNGYIILQPDIVYDTGYPGESAEKCVIPAVQKVVSMGFVDPARVGIQGHSWGGYQITHLITRTNMFRAVEAGASVVNMVSAYGGTRWGTGMSRAFQYEKTQSRIGGPPWKDPLQFIENSPIFWVEKVKTPYLTIHNDEDDAVPWYQGIEFLSAMRRLGKEAYMFNYNGEKHGLRDRDNQKHWTVHMAEFFDHFLLDAPKPEWMEKGVPFLERGTRDLSPIYKKRITTEEAGGK
ncbi:MAG: prolyl oligopeptidase family serine peptidase [Acidobacteria bacterium]|nr:prolyl oligopeptidase family serine peptidase [Acidobacteriota bacterium]